MVTSGLGGDGVLSAGSHSLCLPHTQICKDTRVKEK